MEPRQIEVLQQNSTALFSVLVALAPVFRPSQFDICGDDDRALIHLDYDDWGTLLETMFPFFPNEITQIYKDNGMTPPTLVEE